MKNLSSLFSSGNISSYNLGLLVIRVGIGLIFMRHGLPKVIAGVKTWRGIGNHLTVLGITNLPIFLTTFLGFMSACSEGIGGLLLILGLATRVVAFIMACNMAVAVMFHVARHDAWTILSHPLSLLVVFIGLMIAGAGVYSLDFCFLTL